MISFEGIDWTAAQGRHQGGEDLEGQPVFSRPDPVAVAVPDWDSLDFCDAPAAEK